MIPVATFSGDYRTCKECGLVTTKIEAESRVFNTGTCGQCGGKLLHGEQNIPEKFRF